MLREAIIERVAVVEIGRNKRVSKENCSVKIKRRANLTKDADRIERAFTDRSYLLREREIRVKDDTKILGIGSGRNITARERY